VQAATKTQKIEEDDDDDEGGVFIESKGFISEQDQLKEHEKRGTVFPLQNALVILNKTKPCVFDLKTEKWQIAENEEVIDSSNLAKDIDKGMHLQTKVFSFPDNCSTAVLDDKLNYNKVVPLIITGGNKHGKVSAKAYGISFTFTYKNGLKDIVALQQVELPSLPTPLYLHQTAAVMIEGKTHIIVMGGKNSVESE
jgi:hypothetical protein